MIAATLSAFWTQPTQTDTAPAPRKRRPSPVFIGDAVQPWGTETLLLEVLRRDAREQDDQP